MPKRQTPVYLASDHAGVRLKDAVKAYLVGRGIHVVDAGAYDAADKSDDYPDFVLPAVEAAMKDRARAIVFGGSGLGECIAANKVRGARCATVTDAYSARMCRRDNDANAIALGGRTVTKDVKLALRLVRIWLDTPFSAAPRHKRRLAKIARYER
jgi:ribose 5-phosphate isomerase B